MSDAATLSGSVAAADMVSARINYLGEMAGRPRFHAQDHRRDNLVYDPRVMQIENARTAARVPSLDIEGLALTAHATQVRDFHDPEEVQRVYLPEVARLILELTGASRSVVLPGGGLVRYAERSPLFGTGMNTQPARFPHVDWTERSAPGLADNPYFGGEAAVLQPGETLVGYNIWRVISPPPQDVPLAVCDSRTVSREDLVLADGVYDEGDPETWPTSEAWLLRHDPRHRWIYFRDMQPGEALVFRAYDNLPGWRSAVPHTAFDDPACPPGAPGRESIEARVYAVFDA